MLSKPKPLDIDPSDPFKEDALDRKNVVHGLKNLITTTSGPYVIAIDSPWGTGKTTFIHMLKACIEDENHPCLYFNAWESDFCDDPLIAFIGEINNLLKNIDADATSRNQAIKKTKKIASSIAKRAVPVAVKVMTIGSLDLSEEIEKVVTEATGSLAADLIEEYLKNKQLIIELREQLNLALQLASTTDKKLPIVIFVDELDRCKPTYAIALLERIKHIFNIENAVFIVAIDKKQLSISLSSVYGNGFDAREYLRRFFDLEFNLSNVDSDNYCNSLIRRMNLGSLLAQRPAQTKSDDEEGIKSTFRIMSKLLSLTPRAQERYMTLVSIALRTTPPTHHFYAIEVCILAALKVGAEDTYISLAQESGSIADVIDLLNEKSATSENISGHRKSVIYGVLLQLRRELDKRAQSILTSYENSARTGVTPKTERDINPATLVRVASNHNSMNTPTLRKIISRIDLAAQFSNGFDAY